MIRVYSPNGEYIEDWGGRGEGPGEFAGRPRHIFPYRGDSILVEQFAYDGSNIFDDRGRFGRAVAPEMWLVFQNDRGSPFSPKEVSRNCSSRSDSAWPWDQTGTS